MKEKRTFTRDFKLSVLNELQIKSMAEVCREHNLHQSVIRRWKKEYRENPKKAFTGQGNLCKAEAELGKYKRLVGELYAEIDFLKKTTKRLQQLKAEEEMRHIK